MTALLSASAGDSEKVALYAADARSLGVPVLAPELSSSGWDFEIEDADGRPTIRFGLGAIKNLGRAATEQLLEERQKHGPFRDLNDFARRVDLRGLGKRGLECLVKVGALDTFGGRFALLASLERITALSANHFRAIESGQMSLFGAATGVEETLTLPAVGNPDKREMLNWERELIGLYVSDHPLTPLQPTLSKVVSHFSGQLGDAAHEEPVRIAGLITAVRPYVTKAGKQMGFVTIEDIQGNIELVLFPRTWEKTRSLLVEDQIIVVDGKVDTSNTPPKILVDAVRTDIEATLAEASKSRLTPAEAAARAAKVNGYRKQATRSGGEQAPAKAGPPAPTPTAAKAPSVAPSTGIAEKNADSAWTADSMPPPPDNFPADWEQGWQPSFEHAAAAAQADAVGIAAPDSDTRAMGPTEESTASRKPLPAGSRTPGTAQTPPKVELTAPGLPRAPRTPPSLYAQKAEDAVDPDHAPRQITVRLRSTGDKERDRRRIKAIYGTLISFHGQDRFSFHIFEDGRGVLLDFPGETTRVCPEMLGRLQRLMGEENWSIDEITFQ
jgi:DNA polymerase-3 subunit alpha